MLRFLLCTAVVSCFVCLGCARDSDSTTTATKPDGAAVEPKKNGPVVPEPDKIVDQGAVRPTPTGDAATARLLSGTPASTPLEPSISDAESTPMPSTLPTLAEAMASLNLVELQPTEQSEGVFLSQGALTFSTSETLSQVTSRIQKHLTDRAWNPQSSWDIGWQSLTFQKDDRPATIMVYRGKDPSRSIVEMHFWGGVDLSALSELPNATGLSRTKRSLRYTVPLSFEVASQALHEKLATLQWPLARTSTTHGTVAQFAKEGLWCTSQCMQMENHELEDPTPSSKTTTSVYVKSGPHVDLDTLPMPQLTERLDDSSMVAGQMKSYLAKGTPKDVVKACGDLLQQDGWRSVVAIRGGIADAEALFVQKGCMLQLRASEAQNGTAEVSYYASMLPFDLPDGLDVKTVRLDSAAPHLSFITNSEDVESLTAFYMSHLRQTGWAIDQEQHFNSVNKHMRVFHGSHYLPVLMEVERKAAQETWVELRPVDKTELAALLFKAKQEVHPALADANKQVAAQDAIQAETPPAEVEAPTGNALQAELAKQLQNALEQATSELDSAGVEGAEATKMLADLQKAISAAGGTPDLGDLPKALTEGLPKTLSDALPREAENAGNPKPPTVPQTAKKTIDETHGILGEKFPIPKDAQDLKRKPDLESISYYTTKIRPHAEFFVKELKKLGFRPRGESDVDEIYGFMQFQKGNGSIRISMVHDERNKIPVRVMIMGDGLLWPGGDNEFGDLGEFIAEGDVDDVPDADDPAGDFESPKEHAGIPLPTKLNPVQTGGSPFLAEVSATRKGTMQSVVTFYREEMTKRGWKEDKKLAVVKEDKIQLVFANSGAQLSVELEQFGDEVDLKIFKRDAAKAKAADILPPKGKARIILANMAPKKATITIGTKTYEIEPGQGAKDPAEGKKIDLEPGTYSFTVQLESEKHQDKIKVEAGGTWAIAAIPDVGHFADRVY